MRMKNYSAIFMTLLFFVTGCSKNPNSDNCCYLGKTRLEVLALCAGYPKYAVDENHVEKIMISFNSGYRYYGSVKDATDDENLMQAPTWNINFRKGRQKLCGGMYFYSVTFDASGKVVQQDQSFISD